MAGSATAATVLNVYPGKNGLIAFVRSNQIYTISSTGSALKQLATSGKNYDPVWNPAGTEIAYEHRVSSASNIWVMNANGSDKRHPLTTDVVHTLDSVAERVIAQAMAAMTRRRPQQSANGRREDPVRIEPLEIGDVASAVDLATRVLRVKPGDRGEQFASDITDGSRQMFVAKANGLVIGYGRAAELAADEAGPGTPAGHYLSGVLVEPAWRGRGIATALSRGRLRWVFARAGEAFYVAGADNTASLRLHAALGFQEIRRFQSERSPSGIDVLSRLTRARDLT